MSRPGERVIDSDGNVRVGIFAGPIAEVNYRDYALATALGRPAGRWARYFGFKQFQFLGALSEELVFGCAIANVRYAGTAFLYLYEPSSKRMAEHSFQVPLGFRAEFDQAPETGRASFRSRAIEITMTSGDTPRHRHLVLRLGESVSVDAYFDEESPPQEPMRICTRAGATGWVFARKTAGMPVSGILRWSGRSFDLAAIGARGHCDWSAGYMRRETFWNWGCLAGALPDGRSVGLNVSCGVNETSFTENCFWLGGVLHKLDAVAFEYTRNDLMQPWRLGSFDRRLELEFTPEARHAEKVNAWMVASNFNQLLGRYHGRLTTASGEHIAIEEMLGYAESHYAKW